MNAFLAICNPKKVWDFRAFFATAPTEGFWRFSKKDYLALQPGDAIYLRVTSADPQTGIHAKFVATGKRVSFFRSGHWLPGAEPLGAFRQALFSIERNLLANPISVSELELAGLSRRHRSISVPQASSTQITETEIRTIEALISRR